MRESKVQAVKRLLDGGKGLSEMAAELGIGTGQLSHWAQIAPGGRLGRGAAGPQSRAGGNATPEARGEAARGGGDAPQGGGFFAKGIA
jgi:transposase-like protein